jgi:hypothetical protein
MRNLEIRCTVSSSEVRLVVSAYNDMWLNKESARELANWLFAYLHT